MRYWIAILISLTAMIAYADIFMQTDKDGGVTYTDTPTADAVRVNDAQPETADVTVAKELVPAQPMGVTKLPILVENKPYTQFVIKFPPDQYTFQNEPNVVIEVVAEPKLQTGDKFQAFVDNKAVGQMTDQPRISIGRLERGQHQLSVAIVDKNQKIVKVAPSVTIFSHYAALGPANPNPP